MPKLNGTGPEGLGPCTGRKFGKCSGLSDEEKIEKIGQGLGKRRKSQDVNGKGMRIRSGIPKS